MSYRHLSRCEREIIALRSDAGDKPSQIARLLNRHHTTIRRELQRNGLIGSYDSRVAEEKAVSRRQQARHHCCGQAQPDTQLNTLLKFDGRVIAQRRMQAA